MLPNPLDFHRICRICFSNSEHLTNLFECEIDFVNLLVSMTKLSIHANDDLPQNICPFCSHQIKSMHYFILKCQESDGKLRSSLKTSLVTKNEEEPSNNVQFSEVNSSFDSVYDQIESQPEVKEQRNQKLTRRKNGKNHMGTEQSVGSVKPVCTGRSYKKTIAHTGKRSDQMENIAPTSRNKSESSTKPQNVCCVCNKTFANANNLGRHQLLHQNDKTNQQFQCKVCGKQMKHVNHYKMHMRSHRDSVECSIVDEKPMAGNKKQFMCSTCGRICTSRSNLAVHIRRHTGTMTNFCKICGKGYPRSTDLTIHMRKHTGEKPFLCTICNRGFARSDKLTIHIRTHTGEKPYACTTCTRGFAQRNDLISHQRRNVCGSASDKTENNETAQYTTIQIMTT